MAILNGILRLKGTIGELNFVNIGQTIRVRRKRGTVKPATINNKFRQNVDRNDRVMKTGKPIFRIIKEYAESKRLGRFWPNMLGRLRTCSDDNLETQLQSLKDLEINIKHQLSERVIVEGYTLHNDQDHFMVELKLKSHAIFEDEDVDCYYYELITILWDKDEGITQYTSIPTHWIYHTDDEPKGIIKFERTNWEKYYLLILRLQGGKEGKVSDFVPDRAMAILGGGILD